MIDRAARDVGIGVLQNLRSGRMSPSEFERVWPKRTKDFGVKSVGFWVWTLFNDNSDDPIRIEMRSDEEKILDNSVEFFYSDREFQRQQRGIIYKIKAIFTEGVEWMGCELPWHREWPFPPLSRHSRHSKTKVS